MTSISIPPGSCYELVTTGTCSILGCRLQHTTGVRMCEVCNVRRTSQAEFTVHLRTEAHIRALNSFSLNARPLPPNSLWCNVCRCPVSNNAWNGHKSSPRHGRKAETASFRLTLTEAGARAGIILEGDGNFGILSTNEAEAGGVSREFKIRCTNSNSSASLLGASCRLERASPFQVEAEGTRRVISGTTSESITLKVKFKQTSGTVGRYENQLEVVLQRRDSNKPFILLHTLRAVVGEAQDHVILAATAPYVPHSRRSRLPETKVTAGAEPPTMTVIPYKRKLPPSLIPKGLADVVSKGSFSQVLADVKNSHLPKKFGLKSHAPHFKVLLWIEEAKAEEDMLMYDMENVRLEPHKSHHWLSVPGLAEKRPSVMLGDRILVRKHTAEEGHWYEGRVYDIQQLRIDIRLPKRAKITATDVCDVRFKFNRIPVQRQHQALLLSARERILFPKQAHVFTSTAPVVLNAFFNPLVAENPRQKRAVEAVLSQPPGSAPFIIFGPPGTGKTVTVVESILQLLSRDPKARILACAPSNSAADIIALRLLTLDEDVLFRMYAPSRPKKDVPERLLPHTFTHKDGPFSVPTLAKLCSFRVIVTTCVSAAIPYGVNVPCGHFSHIFIDEAGQATEPEALVSVCTMAGDATNIILSGDPKQLGPVIRSGVAQELGLGKSYIERLMENVPYGEVQGLGKAVVKLTKNFRSHEAILQFPNECFYKNELEACGDRSIVDSFINSSLLVNKKFPVVFYAVPGQDDRESTSPSFFNIDEVTAVKDYVKRLKDVGIADKDIGVVAPYRAQCQKIRLILKPFASGVKVGSVEEFQGDERLVMIISTVRSSHEFLEYDLRFTLGFISNPRRFNVAVTRAKALLLVVGNPDVLSLDPLWRSFMNYIFKHGAWRGDPPSWDTTIPVDQDGETYARQRREAAQSSMEALTARLQDILVEDDVAATDRPTMEGSE